MPSEPGYPPFAGGGRPPDYTEESLAPLAEGLLRYMDRCRKENKFFWWKDWCFDMGFSPRDVAKFCKISSKFREAHELAVDYQESFVTKGALVKKLDSSFSKFYLSNRYRQNWKEKEEVSISDLSVEQLNALMTQIGALQSSVRNNSQTMSSTESKS